MLLGVAGVILALLGVFAVVLVLVIHNLSGSGSTASNDGNGSGPAAAPAAPPAAATGAPAAPAATTAVPTTPGQGPRVAGGPGAPAQPGAAPAQPAQPGQPATPGVAPAPAAGGGKAPGIVVTNALDPTPMWTKAEVLGVANAHQGGLQACVNRAFSADPKVNGFVDVIMQPEASGAIGNVMCNMRNHRGTNGEAVMCSCMQSEMTRWKLPAAHGTIGALKTKNFIYELKLLSP